MSTEEEKLGIYFYQVPDYKGGFITRQVDVKVLDETVTRYQIQLLGFTLKRGPREVFWVAKRKVKLKNPPKGDNKPTGFWWQDM